MNIMFEKARSYFYFQDKERIKELNRVIKLDPKHVGAYYERGATYAYKSDYKKAKKDLEKALSLNPDSETAKMAKEKLQTVDSQLSGNK